MRPAVDKPDRCEIHAKNINAMEIMQMWFMVKI
jgi:hypothetical protein